VTPLDGVPLAPLTTLGLGGPARHFIAATDEETLIEALRWAHARRLSVLVLGGGSNLVVGDPGFDGLALQVATRGLGFADGGGETAVTAAAGEPWDALVAAAVARNLAGLECLSGIPGLVGATPIQNVGAYGQEVAETIASVRCWDRKAGEVRTLFQRDCRFGYRTSRLKEEPGRWLVLEVVFQLRLGDLGAPLAYAELAGRLGAEIGGRAPLADVRDAVLALRRSKGMVLDADDHDTWSAGSFFTNPVLPADVVPPGAPTWPQPDGRVKTSAAWLIEQAGFARGHGNAQAALSGKHTLALTNRGGATATDLVALAREVRDGVRERFGIDLVNEPVLVGCAL